MAKAISQRIRLEGSPDVVRALVDIGQKGERAFGDIQRAAASINLSKFEQDLRALGKAAVEVADGASRLGAAVSGMAQSFQAAGGAAQSFSGEVKGAAQGAGAAAVKVDEASSSFATFAKTVAAVGVGLAGVGAAIFAASKSAAGAVSEIGKAADVAGQNLEAFQKMRFILGQLGLSAAEADAVIKKLGADAKDTGTALNAMGRALLDALGAGGGRSFVQSFAPTVAGFNAMRESLLQLAQAASGGLIPLDKARELLAKFKDSTDPRKMAEYANELGKLVENLKGATDVSRGLGGLSDGVVDLGKNAKTANTSFADLSKRLIEIGDPLAKMRGGLTGAASDTKNLDSAIEQLVGSDVLGGLARIGEGFGDLVDRGRQIGTLGGQFLALGDPIAQARNQLLAGKEAATGFGSAIDRLVGPDKLVGFDRLGQSAKALKESFTGENFAAFARDLASMRNEVDQVAAATKVLGDEALAKSLVTALRGGAGAATALGHVLAGLKDKLSPAEINALRSALQGLGQDVRFKVVDALIKAKPAIEQVDDALAKLRKDAAAGKAIVVDDFVAFATALTKIPDPAERAKIAVKALGEQAGPQLVRQLDDSNSAISRMVARYKELGLGVDAAKVKIADEFNAALKEMSAASAQSRNDLGLLFTPALTPLIKEFTTLMRGNRLGLLEFAASIRDRAIPALQDLLKLFGGAKDSEIKSEGALKLRDALVSIGQTAQKVFNEIILPAFAALGKAADAVAEKINEFFGTKLTGADVGIGAVLAFLIGGFNTLALAVAAAFVGVGPGMDAFREKLKGLGIDVDALFDKIENLFNDLVKLLSGRESEVSNKWLVDLKTALVEFVSSIPAAIAGLTTLFVFLGRWVGFTNLARAAILQFTGALDILKSALIVLSSSLVSVYVLLGIIGRVVIGLAALFAVGIPAATLLFVGLVAALILVVAHLKEIDEVATDVFLTAGKEYAKFRKDMEDTGWVEASLTALDRFIRKLLDVFFGDDVRAAEANFKAMWERIAKVIDAFIDDMMGSIKRKLLGFVEFIGTILAELGKAPGLGALGLIGTALKQFAGEAKQQLDEVVEALKNVEAEAEAVRKAIAAIAAGGDDPGAGPELAESTAAKWRRRIEEIVKSMRGIGEAAKDEAAKVEDAFKGAAGRISGGFREVSPGVWQKIVQDAKKSADKIEELFSHPLDKDLKDTEKFFAPIEQAIKRINEGFDEVGGSLDFATESKAGEEALNGLLRVLTEMAGKARAAKEEIDKLSTSPQRLIPELPESTNIEDRRAESEKFKEMLIEAQTAATRIKEVFEAAFVDLQQMMNSVWTAIGDGSKNLANLVVEDFNTMAETIISRLAELIAQITVVMGALQALKDAGTLPSVGGAAGAPAEGALGGAGLGAAGGAEALLAQFAALRAEIEALSALWTGAMATITTTTVAGFQQITSALTASIAFVAAAVQEVISQLPAGFAELQSVMQSVFASISAGASGAAGDVAAMASSVVSSLNAITAAANEAAAAVAAVGSGGSGGGGSSGGDGGEGFAGGGLFRGRGGRDANLAWLTDNEFVMQVAAVRKYGLDFMRAINEGRFTLPAFSFGGLVDGISHSLSSALAIPRFADGGQFELSALAPASAGHMRVDLSLSSDAGDGVFQVLAPSEVADALGRFVDTARIVSSGRRARGR